MSCTTSRCPTLQKGGHCCQLQHRHCFSASWAKPVAQQTRPGWCPSQPPAEAAAANPLGPQDTQFSGPISPPWHRSRLEALPKPQHPACVCRCSNQTPSWASSAQPREEHESSCVLCVPQSSALIVGFWGVSAPLVLSIAPLPFFSIASTSFTRSGGAISGGLNCSCKSRRGDPGAEGGKEGLSTSSALSRRAGPGHNPGNTQQE